MQTLLEFMTRTKGIEYLLAIVLIVSFYVFWQLLHYRGNFAGLTARVAPALAFILVLGVPIFFSVKSAPSRSLPPASGQLQLLASEVLTNMYGPAWLNHDLHKEAVGDCKFCHHYSGEKILQCRECHGKSFDAKDPNKPGLAHVYHLRCISCHKENSSGPTQCEGCHTQASVPPLNASHPLTQIQKCLGCHGPSGMPGVKKIPADHAGAPESVCQLCHKPPVDSVMKAVRPIPHDAELPDCLVCHGEGIEGAPKVLEDHVGRTDETCLLCHRVEGE